MKKQKPTFFAVLFGAFTLLLAFAFLKSKETYFNRLKEPIGVLVAVKDVLEGTLIDETHLKIEKIPRRFLQPGALFTWEEALGKVAKVPLLKGEQVAATQLAALGGETGLSVLIPPGLRALSVEVDEVSGTAGLIRPNNFVDVLATFEIETGDGFLQTQTQTLAQRVLVLALNQEFQFLPAFFRQKSSSRKGLFSADPLGDALERQRKKTITLALSPKEAQKIEWAKQEGKISFALRPQTEEDIQELSPLTASDVMGVEGFIKRERYREYRGR